VVVAAVVMALLLLLLPLLLLPSLLAALVGVVAVVVVVVRLLSRVSQSPFLCREGQERPEQVSWRWKRTKSQQHDNHDKHP
jgi:hypothetical protein